MKKNTGRLILCLAAVISLLTYSACLQKSEERVKAEAAPDSVTDVNQNNSTGDNNADESSGREILSTVSEPEGRDFLLFNEVAGRAVFPQDFEIGELQPSAAADANEEAIYNTAVNFADTIIQGEAASDYIASSNRDFVERNYTGWFEDTELTGYRIGLINTTAQPVRADIRFLGRNEYFEGTMYFVREGSWKILDFHIYFLDDEGNKKNANEKWFPLYNRG